MSAKYNGTYQKTDKPRNKNIAVKFISLGLIICILLCTIGILCFKYMPILNNELESIPKTDLSGCTYFQTSQENIVSNDAGICFVNNELLLTLEDNFSQDDFEDILLKYDAKIVGEIESLNYYQIQFESTKTYEEICQLIDGLTEYDLIKNAEANHAFRLDSNELITNDSEWKDLWGNVPSGLNWGVEAIEADEAWKYGKKLDSVNIGIMDTMFYTEHKDLSFAEMPFGNEKAKKYYKEFDSHGTHVSGIIGATYNNNIGISGVSIKTNLYGVSLWGLNSGYNMTTINTYRFSFYYLIGLKDCKVINISMGDRLLEFCAAQEDESSSNTPARDELEVLGSELSEFLKLMLDEGHEFIICVCSGNQNGGDYKYFKKDLEDTQIPFDYYSYSDFENYISGKESVYDYSRYVDRKDQISQSLTSAGNIACNNMFTTITDEEIRSRVIIVGAVANQYDNSTQKHNGYALAPFSQCGDQVDIVAPGVDIYSCSYPYTSNKDTGWLGTGIFKKTLYYMPMDGTSQATPMVAGVAGLIFSANSNLTGVQVKDFLCASSVGEYGTEKYGLLNAKNAVESALTFDKTDSNTTTISSIEHIKNQLIGEWEHDETKTYESTGKSMWDLYGSSIRYGSTMIFEVNGSFSYAIGIDSGGTGTFSVVDDKSISYDITTYRAEDTEKGIITIENDGNQLFLVMNYYDNKVYWKKKTIVNSAVDGETEEDSIEAPNDIASPNEDNPSITITDDSSAEDLRKAIIGEWYDPNFAVNNYTFFENGSCKMMFSNAEPGTFKITADKTLKINMPWTTKKLKWDSNCLYSSVGWYFTSDGNLIIEGDVLERQ